MIREVIATGRDVNAAIDSGCAELGINRDNAQFEIISLPKKGFLGLKTYPAKVKVFEELPDPPKAAAPKPAPAPVQRSVPTTTPAPQRPAPKPVQQPKPGEAKREMQSPRPAEPKRDQPRPAPEKKERAPGDEKPREPREDMGEPIPQTEIVPTPELREKVEKAAVYLTEVMRAMDFETIEVTPAYYSESVCLRLSGAQLGIVIGRRGETLDALQYLTSLVANRGEGDYIRINIDSGNYREKREKTLTALAKKLALQAVRTGKSTTLEPMNPYERRVIHGAVSQIRGAVSTSTGTDPNRRVVISVADPAKRTGEATLTEARGDRGGRGRGGDRDRRDRDSRPPAAPRTPLRPNTNTAESVAAARSAPIRSMPHREDEDAPLFTMAEDSISNPDTLYTPPPVRVTRTDDGSEGHTTSFTASADKPTAPPAPPAPAKKLSDAELFGNIPMGVPIVSGVHPRAPKAPAAPAPKHEPKKLDGELYGKI